MKYPSEVTVNGVRYVHGPHNPAFKVPCEGCVAGTGPLSTMLRPFKHLVTLTCHDLGYDCLRTRGVYWVKAEQQTEKEEK